VFRIARALGQDIMVMDFVEAARVRGETMRWIIFREVLPNAAMPLATDFGLRLVFVVLFISSLSFLGPGIQPPMADWGSMVRQNLEGLGYGSYAAVWPALAIATFTISINLIVDDISASSGGSLAKKMI
jgi:peptide/nickel transport system permease protein